MFTLRFLNYFLSVLKSAIDKNCILKIRPEHISDFREALTGNARCCSLSDPVSLKHSEKNEV